MVTGSGSKGDQTKLVYLAISLLTPLGRADQLYLTFLLLKIPLVISSFCFALCIWPASKQIFLHSLQREAMFSTLNCSVFKQGVCFCWTINLFGIFSKHFLFCFEFCPFFPLLFYMVGSRDIIIPIISSIWLKDRHINFCTQRHGSLQSWPVAESTTKFWDCFGGDTIFALYIWNILLLRCLVARLLMVTGDGG